MEKKEIIEALKTAIHHTHTPISFFKDDEENLKALRYSAIEAIKDYKDAKKRVHFANELKNEKEEIIKFLEKLSNEE